LDSVVFLRFANVAACGSLGVVATHGADLLGGGDESARIQSVTDELIRRFDRTDPAVPADQVQAQMDDAVSQYADARIRDFVPILAQKDARAVLRQRSAATTSA
jgi:hypothetical protein